MGKVNYTPNERVNQMIGFAWPAGDHIPHYWRQTIVDPTKAKGDKPNWLAMLILSHVVYKYMPYQEARFVGDEHVIDYKMKFDRRHRYYQTSYGELARLFNESKDRVKAAVGLLEDLGVIKRIYTTESYNGRSLNNCLNIDICIDRLRELTFPSACAQDGEAAGGHETGPLYGEISAQAGPESGPPYGEISAPLPRDLPRHTLREYENKNPNPAEDGIRRHHAPSNGDDGSGSGSSKTGPSATLDEVDGSPEFAAAWDAMPLSKRNARSRKAAAGAWADALGRGIDADILSEGYRSYVSALEEDGCEDRFIAALSTWIAPERPMEGLTLDSAIRARAMRAAEEEAGRMAAEEAERRLAEERAEQDAAEADERLAEELVATDAEARRLHALAFPDRPSRRVTDRLESLREWSAYFNEKKRQMDGAAGGAL